MAITKTHPIKSTLNRSIAYICNPEKTDGQLLISSYACTPETADIEFEWTRGHSSDSGSHIARHIIQSFAEGETTPEQAHEIGMKLAEQALGGKYEFVLATHIDKGCVHNHIIFNSVSFVDFKKYHSNKYSYRNIRKISDKLCEEYNLSVIEPSGNKGKSYAEYTAEKNGTSWKAELRKTIDSVIKRSLDFDDFILRMELAGYTVKRQNKNISFCNSEREKFMRSKTLGDGYTVDAIKNRIKNHRSRPKQERKGVSLLIDIQNSIKAQESKGYEHWAKINNLKQASKTINFLTEHNISSYDELETAVNDIYKRFDDKREELKSVEKQLNESNITLKYLTTYTKLKPVYAKYRMTKNKAEFKRKYQSEIILFETAAKALKGANPPTVEELKQKRSELLERKTQLYNEYRELKQQSNEIDIIKSNIDTILGTEHKRNKEHETEL